MSQNNPNDCNDYKKNTSSEQPSDVDLNIKENTEKDLQPKKHRFRFSPRKFQRGLNITLLVLLVGFVCFQLTTWLHNQTAAPSVAESSVESPVEESSRTESSKTESSKTESSKTESSKTESSKTESSKTESSRTESSRTESSSQSSKYSEPSKAEDSVPASSAETSSAEPHDAHSYFKNTAFMGNSLISGFDVYGIEPNADYYRSIGMSVYGALHTPMSNSEYTAVEQICMHSDYDKIFLMFGTNELGWASSSSFISSYGQIIDKLKSSMPNTQIYIQSITPVTASVNQQNQNGINNARIEEYNVLLKQLAAEKSVGYLDIASIYKDSNGNMADEYSSGDGIHLSPSAYYLWLDYIMDNA